jgi:hypothetical protein
MDSHMRCLPVLLSLFSALFLSACQTAIHPETKARIRSVGVLSLMDPKVEHVRVGTTVFNNQYRCIPAERYQLPEREEKAVAGAICEREVKILSAERERVCRAVRKTGPQGFMDGPVDEKMLEQEVRRLAGIYHLDAVLVTQSLSTQVEQTSQGTKGYSLLQRSFLWLESSAAIVSQSLTAYDGVSGKNIGGPVPAFGCEEISDAVWRDPEGAEAVEALHRAVQSSASSLVQGIGL